MYHALSIFFEIANRFLTKTFNSNIHSSSFENNKDRQIVIREAGRQNPYNRAVEFCFCSSNQNDSDHLFSHHSSLITGSIRKEEIAS